MVPADRRAWLEKATRQSVAEDASVKTAHPLAQEIVYDTVLAGQGYAGPEATRRLNLLKSKRMIYTVVATVDADLLDVIDLGKVGEVQYPRFGLDAGKLLRVIGYEPNWQNNELTLRLWG
jgi:hypothetical protein